MLKFHKPLFLKSHHHDQSSMLLSHRDKLLSTNLIHLQFQLSMVSPYVIHTTPKLRSTTIQFAVLKGSGATTDSQSIKYLPISYHFTLHETHSLIICQLFNGSNSEIRKLCTISKLTTTNLTIVN